MPSRLQSTHLQLCLGIDPHPQSETFESFQNALQNHTALLKKIDQRLPGRLKLKPNLSFFLRFGSQGLMLLEQLCSDYRDQFDIIVDAKFNEISNSLAAQLDFVFEKLGAAGVTINPFLGERTIEDALDKAVKKNGARARVYVLCATSEFSKGPLAHLQQHPERVVEACIEVRERVLGKNCPHALGLVVGANRTDVLLSNVLTQSGLSVLCPGLGAQGAGEEIVARLAATSLKNEYSFPVSRGIFKGGTNSAEQSLSEYLRFQKLFVT